MDAQGALDSLLGRLTTILVNEAQLLGGVRSDVEFIKDEMESMNGLLLHLTEAQHRDHQVWAWMKQVAGLTRDCEGNVELYIHYVDGGPGGGGVLGYLRRILRFLHTVPVRHRIALRIQELKVRARDVGDRRQRYGVTVPPASATGTHANDGNIEPVGDDERRHQRRAVLFDSAEPPAVVDDKVGIDTLIKWLKREPAPAIASAIDHGKPEQVRVFCIVGDELACQIADGLYGHPSVSTLFDCKAWIPVSYDEKKHTTLAKILEQIPGEGELASEEKDTSTETSPVDNDEGQLASKLQRHLEGKRFLINVIAKYVNDGTCKRIVDALLHVADGCHRRSAIVLVTDDDRLARPSSPYKIIDVREQRHHALRSYTEKAVVLGANYSYLEYEKDKIDDKLGTNYTHQLYDNDNKTRPLSVSIFQLCSPNAFAMKMFLHLLYVNPKRTQGELQKYGDDILECKRLNKSISMQVLMWCYSELPTKYRSCMLYLTIFPEGHIFRTTSLARRWAAEGLITTTSKDAKKSAVTDEAEHHLDVLFTRGFVSPLEISPEGNIKSFTLHHEVQELIAKIARDVNFVDTNQSTDLAQHLSIHNRMGLQKSYTEGGSKGIVTCLKSMTASPQWQLLKVLDLEGCQGLKKKHLKSICKILLLRYLSLRNTDITELPKQIKELQCLETLDIRQTKVRVLAKKPIVLPLLKHFLAGHKVSGSYDARTSEESFPAVSMPLCIQKMKHMEVLSHVQVTDGNSELEGISQLLKLRKLGVALQGKNVKFCNLLCQIVKLQKCLRSLSIRMGWPAGSEYHDVEEVHALLSLPEFIERLNICGITSGVVYSIKEHHQLTKITLSDTYLKKDDLCILGNLGALQRLKLQHKSYNESELFFKKCEFQSLTYLLVEGKEVTKIRFSIGAAPKLERILWTFATMDALSGIDWLPRLKKLQLNGDCDLDPIKEALEGHPSCAILEHKPHHKRQAE